MIWIRFVNLGALAVASAGCAGALTTKDRLESSMRLACEARSNGESTSVVVRLTENDATKATPEPIDLALTDRLTIRSGTFGASLSRQRDVYELHQGESSFTHLYEATIPAGSMLEMGWARGDGAVWAPMALPTPPDLSLSAAPEERLTWAPSTATTPEAVDLFVACDDAPVAGPDPPPGTARNPDFAGQRDVPGVVGRYRVPAGARSVGLTELLLTAKPRPGEAGTNPLASCRNLLVVAARSATVDVPSLSFGAAQCFVESSRTLKVPPRGPEPTDAKETVP